MNTPYISVIIPALNEEQTISCVVKNLLKHGIKHVIVVDNGSTDKTAHCATEAGAAVIAEKQKGYGRACLTGIASLPKATDWVLFCDADGSDDLSELPNFLTNIEKYDFIIGNRRATAEGRSNLTPVQNFGNWLSGFLMKIGWGEGFSDLGPLRLIRKEALERLLMQDENFGWTVEMQAKALSQNLSCKEKPVNYLPRQGGVSKISGNFKASFNAGKIILLTLGKLWLAEPKTQRLLTVISTCLLIIGAMIMGFMGDPASPEKALPFFCGASIMITGYLLCFLKSSWNITILFTLAIALRFFLLPMPPGDDVWRYLWEGLIQNAGYNPYNTAPSDPTLAHLKTDWWHGINHKEVTAIYPPLTQLIFRALTFFTSSIVAIKLLFIITDLLIGALLYRSFKEKAAWYLLNPLTIYCVAGGAHYEPLFILPLVAAWMLWSRTKTTVLDVFFIGLLLGVSFSIKIVSLFVIGFVGLNLIRNLFCKRLNLNHLITYLIGVSLPPLLSYSLLVSLSGPIQQLFPSTFTDVARSADLIPWALERLSHNITAALPNKTYIPLLLLALSFTLITARTFAGFQGRCFLILLAFSPMIHGWYFTWALPFALSRHPRTIIALSVTAFLYFLLPYRFSTGEGWLINWWERLILWSPLLLMLPTLKNVLYKEDELKNTLLTLR